MSVLSQECHPIITAHYYNTRPEGTQSELQMGECHSGRMPESEMQSVGRSVSQPQSSRAKNALCNANCRQINSIALSSQQRRRRAVVLWLREWERESSAGWASSWDSLCMQRLLLINIMELVLRWRAGRRPRRCNTPSAKRSSNPVREVGHLRWLGVVVLLPRRQTPPSIEAASRFALLLASRTPRSDCSVIRARGEPPTYPPAHLVGPSAF